MTTLTNEALMAHADGLGYDLSIEDCDYIRETKGAGEAVADAVTDFLCAFETPEIEIIEEIKEKTNA